MFFFYIGRLPFLLNFMVMLSHALSNKSQKEQAFSDVLKNITLANKVLQDLLQNYERLEKIYQSEESLQSDSSLREINQKFKSFTSSKQNIEQKDRSYKKHTKNPYIGTAIIYDEKESEDTKEEINEVNANRKPIESHADYAYDVKVDGKQVTNKDILNKVNKNKEIVKKYSVNENKAKSKDITLEAIQSDEVEQIVIDIPQDSISIEEDIKDTSDLSVATNKPHKGIVKSDSNKPIKNKMGEKTRFSIQHTASKRIERKHLSGLAKIKNNGSRVKKIVHSEAYSPEKNWQQIKNKPIALRKDRELISRKNNKFINNKTITILILANNKEDINNWKYVPKLNTMKGFKQNVRSEYGATCLKMPIKKCKKALQIVNKNICKRRFKCKSDFKSDFIQNSKDGCDKEFAYKVNSKNISNNKPKTSKEKFSPPDFRELKKKSLKTKQDQRDVLSKNKLFNNFKSLRNETTQDAFLRAKLKDKYEKKCQKESAEKCNNACDYAIKETCSVYTCEKKKKKALKGECKFQCKKAYTDVKKSVESSNQSDSGSVSESDSDSESDGE